MKMPDDQHDDELASYLGAFRYDVVPVQAKKKVMVALGLSAITATTSTAVAASAILGAGRVTVLAVVKSIAGGALAGAVVMGATSYIQDRTAADAQARSSHVAALKTASTSRAPVRGQAEPNAAPVEDPRVVAEASPPGEDTEPPTPPLANAQAAGRAVERQPGVRNAPPAEAAEPEASVLEQATPNAVGLAPSTLAREVLMLDLARTALARRDAAAASSLLDGYAREFGNGKLVPEATMLRVETLLLLGDHAGAEAVGRAFEQAHPGHSHLRRLHSLLSR